MSITEKKAGHSTPAGHTPGPWKNNKSEIYTDNQQESFIADVFDENGDWQANARLIASAPDLLEALQSIREYFCDMPMTTPEVDSLIERVCGVINKAEGVE